MTLVVMKARGGEVGMMVVGPADEGISVTAR